MYLYKHRYPSSIRKGVLASHMSSYFSFGNNRIREGLRWTTWTYSYTLIILDIKDEIWLLYITISWSVNMQSINNTSECWTIVSRGTAGRKALGCTMNNIVFEWTPPYYKFIISHLLFFVLSCLVLLADSDLIQYPVPTLAAATLFDIVFNTFVI